MRWKLGCKTAVPVLGIAALLFGAAGARAATLEIQSAEGAPGSTIQIDAVLVTSQGEEVAGTDNVIAFTNGARITACAVNGDIGKEATAFSFRPSGCDKQTSCETVRPLVLSLSNVDPIPSGSVVYTCDVVIAADATPGDAFPLTCSGALASSPGGDPIDLLCPEAVISVPEVTPTPTFTVTPEVPTPTITPTRTNTRPPSTDEDDDGCQVVAPASGNSGWLLLVPAGMLLWLRRRAR